ncbi:MAG TPA: serine/threonine-protein kinase, partial [Pyrinomonadaceae bacterium]|nr:serine/threonine-protein kinase [Pyrinomonadaceae bacterium]
MDPAKWQIVKSNFSAILELPENERPRFLESCGAEVRREIENLLTAHEKAEEFINQPFFFKPDSTAEDHAGKQIDDYLILEKIGTGGMGAVFLAEHRVEDFSQKVALKLIKRGMDTAAVLKRFLMERQILAQLEHPNIARLLDGGSTADGLPYFVMEYVEGENIRDFCNHHAFDLRERLELFQKVCTAVSYAHQKLIVHRDIKPSNIIVPESGEPKLLDFGIAKLFSPDWNASEAEATATNIRLMTPEYASPEQLRGQMTTTATDVYSLGVVLYELLTGTRPFDFKTKNPVEISEAILKTEPVRPSAWISDLGSRISDLKETVSSNKQTAYNEAKTNPRSQTINPKSLKGDLDNIILKAIRREPERRYQSVEEFCDDIHRYLNNLPVGATADSRRYRVGKFYNRHRTGVLTGIAVSLLLIVSTAVSGWQFFVAQQERARSEQRFNELRGVAKSLLTDTNAALAKLPRSGELRKSILEKSVAVLDSLAKEETSDADFLNEIADAYDQLGYVRNWSFRETENSLDDYRKALALREKSLETASNKVEVRKKIAQTLGGILEVYNISGNAEKSLEISERLRSNYREIFALDRDNTQTLLGLSIESETLADQLKAAGRGAESAEEMRQSFEFIERAIEICRNNLNSPADQTQLVFYWMQKGNLLEKTGRDDEALEIYRQAAELAEKTYRADNSQTFAFNHTARTHRLMGDIFKRRGNFQKALEMYQFSLNLIKQNTGDPKLDARNLNYAEAINSLRVGSMLDKTGKRREAAAMIEEGLNIFRERLKVYSDDASEVIYAPEPLQIASDYYIATDQTEKGVRIWDEFRVFVEKFALKNPDDAGIKYNLSFAYRKKGDVLSGFDEESQKSKITNRENLRQAKASYEKSLEILRETLTFSPSNIGLKE